MPGYGFSGKPTTTGWDPVRIGKAYVELMKRLGYTRFVAQGGDWGAVVVDAMAGGRADPAAAEPAPPELIGIHTNMAGVIPPDALRRGLRRQPGAVRSLRRGAEHVRAAARLLRDARGVRADRWGRVRRRSTDWRTHPIDLAAFMLDHGDGSGQPGIVQQVLEERLSGRATSRVTTSWTTSRSSG